MSHDTPRATENVAAAGEIQMTVAEVATRLRVSRSHVYALLASGQINASRHGVGKIRPRGYRVAESEVERHLAESSVNSAAPAA